MVSTLDIAVMFQVEYDTPHGTARMKVVDYTKDAAARGVKCQMSHRALGEAEKRAAPQTLEEVLHTETSAAVLDGENMYLRIIDHNGKDLAVSKIDEARWPRDANPTTVKTVRYWLNVPPEAVR